MINLIKQKRKEKKLTQEKLASMCEVHIQSIKHYENFTNFPNVKTLIKIIDILELKPEDVYKNYFEYKKGELKNGYTEK